MGLLLLELILVAMLAILKLATIAEVREFFSCRALSRHRCLRLGLRHCGLPGRLYGVPCRARRREAAPCKDGVRLHAPPPDALLVEQPSEQTPLVSSFADAKPTVQALAKTLIVYVQKLHALLGTGALWSPLLEALRSFAGKVGFLPVVNVPPCC